ncbi:MAG: phosphoribosylglycinamide formyltransferase [Clostridia bacterium]|nr:phosphoribosylglycinamide formyltransferase [Clostridia bacterium]
MKKVKIAVLVSGGGTNLQALIDAQSSGIIQSGKIVCVISSKPGAYALTRAKNAGIDAFTVPKKECADQAEFEEKIEKILIKKGAELIILAGFMSILSADFTKKHENRIINVHPALIPSFCGAGYYGLKVHEAALGYGVKVTGATVHFVNEIPDGGKIIMQKAVRVHDGDTPEKLQKRVMKQAEWKILPASAELVCKKILNGEV